MRPDYVYIMDFGPVKLWVEKTHGMHFGKALCMDEGPCRRDRKSVV